MEEVLPSEAALTAAQVAGQGKTGKGKLAQPRGWHKLGGALCLCLRSEKE